MMSASKLKILADTASPPSRAVLLLLKVNKIPFTYIESRILETSDPKAHPELISLKPVKKVPQMIDGGYSIYERAVMLLLAVNKIPYEYVKISLKDSENLTHPELGSINPSKRIPAIEDNGYTLFESTAILKYICNKYGLADHWYPKDIKRQGKVDEALNWFPQNLRCGAYYLTAVLPRKSGKCTPEALIEHSQTTVKKSIQVVEDYYLMNTKFVAGDEISIADLLYIAEVTQYLKMGVNLAEGRPKVTQWLSDVKEALQPYYDEIYKEEYRTVEAKTFFTEMKY